MQNDVYLNLYEYTSCGLLEALGLAAYHSSVEYKYGPPLTTATSNTTTSWAQKTPRAQASSNSHQALAAASSCTASTWEKAI